MIALAVVIASLTGCAGTVYRTDLEVYCPQITQYDVPFNNKLADEIASLPPQSEAIGEAVKDYVHLRDRIRLCHEEKGNV
jgi:hypothetical protein